MQWKTDTFQKTLLKNIVEDIVINVSVFIDPSAKDFRKIYQYNYGATKLAIRRAMEGYPDIEKVLAEKDRGTHPIMGFKVKKLWSPPYLQVALDLDNESAMERIIADLPDNDRILLEAGTPLVKKFGVGIIGKIRALRPDAFIIADLKTLDVGRVEVKMAADETADAVAISGLGTIESIAKAIHETQKQGIYSILDMMNVKGFEEKLAQLPDKHSAIKALSLLPVESNLTMLKKLSRKAQTSLLQADTLSVQEM